MKTHTSTLLLIAFFTCLSSLNSIANTLIDPIKFTISTKATEVSLNEEFQLDIRASYMNVPSNTVFVFDGANVFRLKLVLPDGFEQTGGSFSDYIGTALSPARPNAVYTVKGRFTRIPLDGTFHLLRGHQSADENSTFIAAAKAKLTVKEAVTPLATADSAEVKKDESKARVAAIRELTIAQLRAGQADTASLVQVTDPGREGLFKFLPGSKLVDDNGVIIVATGGRRYERQYEGAVNVRWFNVIADGVTDQSAAIQKITDHYTYRKNVFFPKGSAPYKMRTLRVMNNTNLTFEPGTIVEGTGTLGASERMFYIYDVANITIMARGAIFRDLKSKYTSGQQRHIFSMEGVANVTIDGATANDSGGDGFYVGQASVRKISENIKLLNVTANNNRRQGLSVVSVKGMLIQNSAFNTSSGEGPQAGIDLEPGNVQQALEDIRIENVTTAGNRGGGLIVNPGKLANTGKRVTITIVNHVDDGSQIGFIANYVNGVLNGAVEVHDAVWKNSKLNGFVARNWGYRAMPVNVHNPTIINCNSSNSTSPTASAAFYVHREQADAGDTHIGNIHIFSPIILDNRATKLSQRAFSFKDWNSNNKILNCSVVNPVKTADYFPQNNMIVNSELDLSDENQTMVHEIGNSGTMANYTYYRPWYFNAKSTSARNIVLSKVNAGFPEINVEVKSPYNIYIIPEATDNILPISGTAGKWITSKVVGSTIKLRKTSDNTWTIVEMTGSWYKQP